MVVSEVSDVLERCRLALEDRYDGTADSPTLWMGKLLEELTTILHRLKGAQ